MAGVSLITGGGSGIGRQTAISLGQAGDAVAVADIDEAAARRTVDAILGTGGIAAAYALDVADPAPAISDRSSARSTSPASSVSPISRTSPTRTGGG